ncbi:P-loop containing nucleoside triphosphate hydrolase protein [Corynascus similis CBS 632.67]
MDPPRTIIIGISGCSSSGKTTLARLLRDMFPETFILHEDDFYKPESELPIKDGLADWDCPEAISIPDLEAALAHVRATGTFPPNVNSLEDLNTVGPCPATPDQIAACAAKVRTWLSPDHPGALIFPSSSSKSSPNDDDNHKPPKTRMCILDGFLLYSPPPDLCSAPKDPPPSSSSSPSPLRGVMAHLDVKIFLQASKAKALQRREARDGYVHMDGFWKDPPGYVERIVWPNYVESHRWLFEDGDVEGQGRLDRAVLEREGILAPGLALTSSSSSSGEGGGRGEEGGRDGNQDIEFGRVLEWAVEVVMRELERLCLGEEDRTGQKK